MALTVTCKYGNPVLLATYKLTAILLAVSLLDNPKEINHNDKLLSTAGSSAFVCFADLLVGFWQGSKLA